MSTLADSATYTPTPTATGGDDVLSNIPPELVGGTTAAGMFAGLFWMLATGRLVTRREHEGRVADKNEVIATQKTTIDVKDKQLENLAVVGETVIRILHSVEGTSRGTQP